MTSSDVVSLRQTYTLPRREKKKGGMQGYYRESCRIFIRRSACSSSDPMV